MENYFLRISKDQLAFSAAHFITYEGDVCERLHGHNYRVGAEVHGPLNEHQYVVDFIAVRDALQKILEELDHYVLLPTEHPAIQVNAREREVEVRFAQQRWVFPRGDCRLLPVANTTAEMLGRYIAQRLMEALERRCGSRPSLLRIEVDECLGQSAVCELRGA